MDGRYVKLEIEDYKKTLGIAKQKPHASVSTKVPAAAQPILLESVLEYEDGGSSDERPPWDNSSAPKSYKVTAKQLEERRKLRTSHNLEAARKELHAKTQQQRSRSKPPSTAPGTLQASMKKPFETLMTPPVTTTSKLTPTPPPERLVSEMFALPSLEKVSKAHQEQAADAVQSEPLTKEDATATEELAKSVQGLQEKLERMTNEYEVLKREFEAQKKSMAGVKEERDKNKETVRDLSRILTVNHETQLNMANTLQTMKSKMEMLEKGGLFQQRPIGIPAVLPSKAKNRKKVSFNLSNNKQAGVGINLELGPRLLDPNIGGNGKVKRQIQRRSTSQKATHN